MRSASGTGTIDFAYQAPVSAGGSFAKTDEARDHDHHRTNALPFGRDPWATGRGDGRGRHPDRRGGSGWERSHSRTSPPRCPEEWDEWLVACDPWLVPASTALQPRAFVSSTHPHFHTSTLPGGRP